MRDFEAKFCMAGELLDSFPALPPPPLAAKRKCDAMLTEFELSLVLPWLLRVILPPWAEGVFKLGSMKLSDNFLSS